MLLGRPGWKKLYGVDFSRDDRGGYTILSVSIWGKRAFTGSGSWDDATAIRSLQDAACAMVADAYGATVDEVRGCL